MSRHTLPHPTPIAPRVEVNDWADVPTFADECEEHEFWATHCLGPALLDQMVRAAEEQRG